MPPIGRCNRLDGSFEACLVGAGVGFHSRAGLNL